MVLNCTDMANIQIITTDDGSSTLLNEAVGQTYHSSHGAQFETEYVYIDAALRHYCEVVKPNCLRLLDVGFGTGLDVMSVAMFGEQNSGVAIECHSLEKFPISYDIYSKLSYAQTEQAELFMKIHSAKWNELVNITKAFDLVKHNVDILDFLRTQSDSAPLYDVVFYDAFSPDVVPELWQPEIFSLLYKLMSSGAVLTTYCAKGDVRRAMIEAGFVVEKLQGPPGKRHILRAKKI